MTEDIYWKKCSTCRTPMAFGAEYLRCSVSTCNKKRAPLLFCSMTCWDAHQAEARHRDAWAEQERAPSREQFEAEKRLEAAAAQGAQPSAPAAPRRQGKASREVLIIASKLKDYVRARADMSTSDRVFGVLSDHLRAVSDEACETARRDGRKTVLDRDVKPLFEHEGRSFATGDDPKESSADTLVVVSKLKSYIKDSAQMNTSDGVIPILSDHVRYVARQAIRHAGADGRKTLLDRDFLAAGAVEEITTRSRAPGAR